MPKRIDIGAVVREKHVHIDEILRTCPHCGGGVTKHSVGTRRYIDLGSPGVTREVVVTYNKFACYSDDCGKYSTHPDLHREAGPSRKYSYDVQRLACEMYASGLTLKQIKEDLAEEYGVPVSQSTVSEWWNQHVEHMLPGVNAQVAQNRQNRKVDKRLVKPLSVTDLYDSDVFDTMGEGGN